LPLFYERFGDHLMQILGRKWFLEKVHTLLQPGLTGNNIYGIPGHEQALSEGQRDCNALARLHPFISGMITSVISKSIYPVNFFACAIASPAVFASMTE